MLESAKEREKIVTEISQLESEVQKSIEVNEIMKVELLRKIQKLQERLAAPMSIL
jgi:regulator of replication initiation timing